MKEGDFMKYSELSKEIQNKVLYHNLNEKTTFCCDIVYYLFSKDNDFNEDKILENIGDFSVDEYIDQIGHQRVVNAMHNILLGLGLDEIDNEN